MATVGDNREAWINAAYYAYDADLNIYIFTPGTTQHSRNLERNHSVAVSIFDSHQDPKNAKKGLQISGIGELAADGALTIGFQKYSERYVWFREYIKTIDDFNKGITESRIYVIRPKMIKIFDEPVFGEDNWVTVRL